MRHRGSREAKHERQDAPNEPQEHARSRPEGPRRAPRAASSAPGEPERGPKSRQKHPGRALEKYPREKYRKTRSVTTESLEIPWFGCNCGSMFAAKPRFFDASAAKTLCFTSPGACEKDQNMGIRWDVPCFLGVQFGGWKMSPT